MWRKIKTFFNNHWYRLSQKQKYFVVGLVLLLIFTPIFTFAGLDVVTKAVLKILTGVISILVSFFGKLLAVVLHVLVYVAQYNNFIKEKVVIEGWKVVRDVCNMFFVLGLLIIAFGTVLRIQNYQAKNLLRSFIFGAIFVNFSKTICGLILDFSQIIMLTFVNGFKDVGAGNLTEMLGLTALFKVVTENSDASAEPLEGLGVFISYLLGLIYIVVALVVILTMTIMLIQRAVMLWIYIILSPFPYLLSALPKAGKLGQAGSRWWSDFTGLVITGPMLAFFIWLSFFTASGSGLSNSTTTDSGGIQLLGSTSTAAVPNNNSDLTNDINAGVTESGTAKAIIKFLVSIGLLWGGMMLTKETSSLVGGVVGAGMSNLKKMGNKVKKTASGIATGATKNTAKWAGRNTLKGVGGLTYAMSKNSNSKVGQMFQKLGTAGKTWGDELTEERKKEKTKKRLNTLKKIGLGVGDKTMSAFKDVADDDVVKTVGKTVKGARTFAAGTALTAMTGGLGLVAPATTGILGTLGVMTSGAVGLAQSPFNKLIGRNIKKMIGGTTVPAYEDAYDKRHIAIKNAAIKMNSERQIAAESRDKYKQVVEKDFREGKISKQTYESRMKRADNGYSTDVKKSINDYRDARAQANEQMYDKFIDIRQSSLRQKGQTVKADKEKNKYEAEVQKINTSSLSAEAKKAAILKAKQDFAGGSSMKNVGAKLPILTAWLAGGSALKNLGQGIENYHPFQLTSDAAALHLKNNEAAQNKIKQISQRTDHAALLKDLGAGDFSGGLAGITSKHQNLYQALTNSRNPAETTNAINNLVGAVGTATPGDKKDEDVIKAMLRGIAGFQFNGGDVSRLQPLINALNSQAAGTGGKVDQYDDYLKKAVKMRQVGSNTAVDQGDGSLRVNSFASGRHKTNIIGADFSQLKSLSDLTPDIETDQVVGANIASEKMAAVAGELTGLIDNELAALEQAGSTMVTEPLDVLEQKISQLRDQRFTALQNGNLDEASSAMEELEPLSRIRDLRVAKDKLADPANLGNLSLKNTGVSLASARESQTTNIHEALHGFGLDNEGLTENIAQKMAAGSYRVDDAANIAQSIKNIMAQKNISQEQITPEDIAQAINGIQPANQVEQIIAKEGGETIINNQITVNNITNYNQEEGDGPVNDNSEYNNGTGRDNENSKKIDKLSDDIKQRQRLEDYRYFRGLNEDKKDRRRAENIEKTVKQTPKQ